MSDIWVAVGGTLLGALIGAVIAPFLNHRYRMQQLEKEHEKKLDYMKKESFFKKKLEYFEKISEKIENKIVGYNPFLDNLEKGESKLALQSLKEIERVGAFSIVPSPLYTDNLKTTVGGIIKFMELETEIGKVIKESKDMKDLIKKLPILNKIDDGLMDAGKETFDRMREELKLR